MCATDRGFTWSDDETAVLLRLWGGRGAQSELTGNKRNFAVYERIAETMDSLGHSRNASQCREKIKRMKREYTLAKQRGSRAMRFFDQFEKILLEKRQQDTGDDPLEDGGLEAEVDEESSRKVSKSRKKKRKGRRLHLPKRDAESTNSPTDTKNTIEKPSAITEVLFPCLTENNTSSTSVNGGPADEGSKTQGISLFHHTLDSLAQKFVRHQAESDARAFRSLEELEKERTASDNRIRKMWLNFESRRGEEERKHELSVMATLQDIAKRVARSQTF